MVVTSERTHYEVLDVPADASLEMIKKAYRRLARELHPDLHPDDPDAGPRFAEVTNAHTVLSDPAQRAMYDLALATPTPGDEPDDDPEDEPWGVEVEVEVDQPEPAPAPAQLIFKPAAPVFAWRHKTGIPAVLLAIVGLVVLLEGTAPTGTPPQVAYLGLGVVVLAVHRAFFTSPRSLPALVLAVVLCAALPVIAWTAGPVPIAVAVVCGVPMLVAGELIRAMRH